MKKIITIILSISVFSFSAHAQSVYELSFTLPNNAETLKCDAFFIDYNDGKGNLRVRFKTAAAKDSALVDFEAIEELVTAGPGCTNGDWIYYKLTKPKFIESTDPGISFPKYICLVKDTASGLFEPKGFTNSATDCNSDLVKFSKISTLEQNDMTKEFVLSYFKPYDVFYRNIFVTNTAKALTTSERNVKLYLLIVANVTDELIGTANRKGMDDAIKFFGKVKDFLGIGTFVYETVTDEGFTKQTVLNKINSFITPGDKDIVVFYYAGHGFRQPRDGRPGPYIDLRDLVKDKNKKYLENSLSMEDIRDMIKRKGARLNLILSDCCNDNVTSTNPMAVDAAVSGKKGMFDVFWSTNKCRDLFLNAMPTTIMATAASPYQLAISNAQFGGYFTNFLFSTLESNLSLANRSSSISWTNIFDQVKSQTLTKSGRTWCNTEKTVVCNRQRPFENIRYGRF